MRRFISVKLPINFYKEGNKFIAYCSALDISTSGNTFEEAKKNFDELVDVFLDETTKMGTLGEVLLECGWKRTNAKPISWKPPIRRFITQTEEEIDIPCPA